MDPAISRGLQREIEELVKGEWEALTKLMMSAVRVIAIAASRR